MYMSTYTHHPPSPNATTKSPNTTKAYAAEFTRRVALVPAHALPKALMSAYRGLSPQLVQAMCEDPTVASTAVRVCVFVLYLCMRWLRTLHVQFNFLRPASRVTDHMHGSHTATHTYLKTQNVHLHRLRPCPPTSCRASSEAPSSRGYACWRPR